MRYKFKYVKAGKFKRPIISITLKNKKKEFSYYVLIDSGADFNIFHADLAEILGIDLNRLQTIKFSGVKKDADASGWYTYIKLGVGNALFEAPVIFSDGISNDGYGIVGQQGFFDHFKIHFNYKAGDIELKTK